MCYSMHAVATTVSLRYRVAAVPAAKDRHDGRAVELHANKDGRREARDSSLGSSISASEGGKVIAAPQTAEPIRRTLSVNPGVADVPTAAGGEVQGESRTTVSRSGGARPRPHDAQRSISNGSVPEANAAHQRAPVLKVTEWRHAEPRAELATHPLQQWPAHDGDGTVISVEVPFGADAAHVHRELQRICDSRISGPMVEDLLCTDDLPKRREWPGTNIRSVSAVAARAAVHHDPIQCELEFDVVELLAGPNWIVVACHTEGSYVSQRGITLPRAGSCESLLSTVESRWVQSGARTAGDLGLLVVDELAKTHRAARRSLGRCIERWERDCFREDESGPAGADRRFRERLVVIPEPVVSSGPP